LKKGKRRQRHCDENENGKFAPIIVINGDGEFLAVAFLLK